MSKALFLGFNKKGKDILEALREYEEEERKRLLEEALRKAEEA